MKNKTFAALSVLLLLGTIPLFRTKPPVAAAQAQSLPDLSKVSLRACITLPAELPDYQPNSVGSRVIEPRKLFHNPASKIPVFHKAAWEVHGLAAGTFFKRLSDENMISVDVAVCPTEAETQALMDEARETQTVFPPFPEGSLSKRPIGQHVYVTPPKDGKYFVSYNILAQDGRAKVIVTELTKTLNVNGRPVPTEMPAKDALLCEDIALRVLDRLTFLGHTSQPANSASKEAQQQVLDWIAAHPDSATSKP